MAWQFRPGRAPCHSSHFTNRDCHYSGCEKSRTFKAGCPTLLTECASWQRRWSFRTASRSLGLKETADIAERVRRDDTPHVVATKRCNPNCAALFPDGQ